MKNEETLFLRKQEICGKLQISVFLKKVLYNFSVIKYNAGIGDENRGATGDDPPKKRKNIPAYRGQKERNSL